MAAKAETEIEVRELHQAAGRELLDEQARKYLAIDGRSSCAAGMPARSTSTKTRT